MKNIIFALIALTFVGCGNKKKTFAENASSIADVKEALIDKFGKDAYFTNIFVSDAESGSLLTATTTSDPSSLKMESWSCFQGNWKQDSEITLELSGDDVKAEDFMFQLDNDVVDFALLGKLVEQSKEKLTKEKNIETVTRKIFINAPDDGDFEDMTYYIINEPKSGGTSFSFHYKMDGTLEDFSY